MLEFIEGKISDITPSYIVISTNGIGFQVYTPNPYSFKESELTKVYLYNHIREEEYTLYGFKSKEERELFLKLINVKGLGPKTGIGILAGSTPNGIIDAIERENILYIKKFPKVGEKLARQIILDLKGKVVSTNNKSNVNEELIEALLALGYKRQDVSKISKEIDSTLPIETQLKEALKLLFR